MKKMLGLAPKKKSVESVSESTSSPLNSNPSTTLPPPDFSNTLASNQTGPNILLANLLDSKSLSKLSQVSRGTQKVYGDAVYRALIKEEIGPNPEVLIKKDETAKAAYERHKKIISDLLGLGARKGGQETIWGLWRTLVYFCREYPNYYFKHVLKDEDFDSYFPSYAEFLNALRVIEKEHPKSFDLVMNRIIADLDRITRLIDAQPANGSVSDNKWCLFVEKFHKYASQLIREMSANNQLFIRMIPAVDVLMMLTCNNDWLGFEEYGKNVRNQVFAHNDIFIHFFGSIKRWQQLMRECVLHSRGGLKKNKISYLISVVEKILNDDKLFEMILGDEHKLQAFRASFSEKYSDRSGCFLDFAKPEALELIRRVEKRFAELKNKASQQDAKDTAPPIRGSDDPGASSSFTTTSLYEPSGSSMFTSSPVATTSLPQGQAPVREAKEEAKQGPGGSNFSTGTPAVGLPVGDNGGASTQTSSRASNVDLLNGDDGEDEDPGRSSLDSPHGSS